ncbi:MAG: hypothetical protein K9M82_11665, partial [Deltaproteobacteria bacterium]|nr:hypothetical protein [Deltaproteobacteria bacterium]
PFLATRLSPRGWSYPVERLASLRGTGLLREVETAGALESGLGGLLDRIRREQVLPEPQDRLHTHRLPMDRSFLDFLRLAAGIRRLTPRRARTLKALVDEALDRIV